MAHLNLSVLEEVVTDYFQAEEELHEFLKTWIPGGWWLNRTAKEREDSTKFNERRDGKWNTVSEICRLLNIDWKSLLAVVKAINRYTRHNGKWDRYTAITRLNYWQEEEFFNLISDDYEKHCYQSTGRSIKSA